MELQQAINVLDAATSRAPLTRQEHQAVVDALKAVAALLPKPAVVEDAKRN